MQFEKAKFEFDLIRSLYIHWPPILNFQFDKFRDFEGLISAPYKFSLLIIVKDIKSELAIT